MISARVTCGVPYWSRQGAAVYNQAVLRAVRKVPGDLTEQPEVAKTSVPT
jgi:hypothetical protein